jgi:hypothetical protein
VDEPGETTGGESHKTDDTDRSHRRSQDGQEPVESEAGGSGRDAVLRRRSKGPT